jgi:conjugative relaxase-like TrwC/TraI family protein
MIRITQYSSAAFVKGCYGKAAHHRQGRGIVGSWGGKGAFRLGLTGTVDKFSFFRLCENVNPRTGDAVTVRTRAKRTVGYMFTFSVPKSVSLLYGLTGDSGILDAFRAAVGESMREMEPDIKTRVRKAGQDSDRGTGNMVWAELLYATAAPLRGRCDPQLHAFVFVFNMTWDEQEQLWKAGVFRDLKSDAPYFEAAFRVRVANKLLDLGFRVERKGKSFEIAGIPSDVLKRFSRRTEQIEGLVRERGILYPKGKAALGPKCRERARSVPHSLEVLREEWNTRLTDQERQVVASVYRRETPYSRQINAEAQAVDHAIEHCFVVREAVVPERKLLAEALQHGLGAVTVENVRSELSKRPLVWSDVAGRKMARLNAD